MGEEKLKVTFRCAGFGNIACLHVEGSKNQNDINNEDAIMLFNSLVGQPDNSLNSMKQQLSQLQQENDKLKKSVKSMEEFNEAEHEIATEWMLKEDKLHQKMDKIKKVMQQMIDGTFEDDEESD